MVLKHLDRTRINAHRSRSPALGRPLDPPAADHSSRELREEAGLDIEPVALTGVYKDMNRAIVALVFRCKITGGTLTTNDEVTAFRWATADDITDLAAEAYAVRVRDALDDDRRVAVRHHDGVHLT